MHDYVVCLADLTKDAARAHVDTYAEDVDLDHRYEKLPVSPLLRAYFTRSQEGLPAALQQCLKETEESKPRKLAVMQWLLDPAVKKIFIDENKTMMILIPIAIALSFTIKGASLYTARTLLIQISNII